MKHLFCKQKNQLGARDLQIVRENFKALEYTIWWIDRQNDIDFGALQSNVVAPFEHENSHKRSVAHHSRHAMWDGMAADVDLNASFSACKAEVDLAAQILDAKGRA